MRRSRGTTSLRARISSFKDQDQLVSEALRIADANLTNEIAQDAPIIFGWLLAGHQLGAGVTAFEAGMLRSWLGDYYLPVLISGALCVVTAPLVLRIGRTPRELVPAT